jgi:hypothetical protein
MAKKRAKAKSGSQPKVRAITGNDLQKIREMYDLTSVDLSWLMARPMHAVRLSQKGGADKPLRDKRLSILARILLHEADRELIPIPKAPGYDELFDRLGKLWPPEKYKKDLVPAKQETMTRDAFGLLFGASLWSSFSWRRGGAHDLIVDRLFWVVSNLIDKHGRAALDLLADLVDEEARARGVEGGLLELMRTRRWTCNKSTTSP